jgi:glucoamylase
MKKPIVALLVISAATMGLALPQSALAQGAPGAKGAPSVWTYAGKQGLGTSYEAYVNKEYQDGGPTGTISKVWFSTSRGIVTETAYGLIHEAQIKDLQLLVTGNGFLDEEKVDTKSTTEYLHTDSEGRPLSLAYRIVNEDREGKYKIEKHVFTDPDRQALFMRVIFTANEAGITPYLLVNPHVKNTGSADVAYVGADYLNARQGLDEYMSLRSSAAFTKTSAGFVGTSDGYTDLADNGQMDWHYGWADDGGGNVAMIAELPTVSNGSVTFDVAVGFGSSHTAAMAEADGALGAGYRAVLDTFNGTGSAVGWEDYLTVLGGNLAAMRKMTNDGGKLLNVSAMVLKALEDKTHAGALIASLSVPWGDAKSADGFETGYRAVWPRDFYQCAMALLALGDNQTPLVSFEYLPKVQVTSSTPGNQGASGWFLQKTHVDGKLEWYQVQMDQTAMPIMLGWKLWQAGLLSNADLDHWYRVMLKPAAEFLANGGYVDINGSAYQVDPPWTRMERWEEQAGYSPSTTAAEITGLVTAADIADAVGDPGAASRYRKKADEFAAAIESTMFTTTGPFGNGKYFLRITQNTNPNDGGFISGSNGRPALDERQVLDPGFLELVRYGVRAAADPHILDSLPELDDTGLDENLRVYYKMPCKGGAKAPGWRRYGNDGYGERTSDGGAYLGGDTSQRGRVWPFLTGERGHYELELAKAKGNGNADPNDLNVLRDTYVRAMECFADGGLMLPEQVWDGVGNNGIYDFATGEGTDSATALAWTHAEYIKLVKSLSDGNTWDSYQIVRDRYIPKFKYTYPQMYLRGTNNAWGTDRMDLVADHTWRIKQVPFGGGPNERFKFDVAGDWSNNYGDNNSDGIGDYFGADIPITQGAGSYTITFNDETKAYTVTKN